MRCVVALTVVVWIWLGENEAQAALAAPSLRNWAIEDSIAFRYFSPAGGDLSFFRSAYSKGTLHDFPIVYSPNGESFYYVAHYGDLRSNEEVFELTVYSVEVLEHALRTNQQERHPPLRRHVVRSASGNSAGISEIAWTQDSRGLVFVADCGKSGMQICLLSIEDGVVMQLTDSRHPPANFQYLNGILVYRTREPGPSGDGGMLATRWPLSLQGGKVRWMSPNTPDFVTYLRDRAGQTRKIALGRDVIQALSPCGEKALLKRVSSLNGRRAVTLRILDVQGGSTSEFWAGREGRVGQGTLPMGGLWSLDGQRVIIANTTIPGKPDSDDGYLVEYDFGKNNWRIICPMRMNADPGSSGPAGSVSGLAWRPNDQALLVSYQSGQQTRVWIYERSPGGAWTVGQSESPSGAALRKDQARLEIRLLESENTPPAIAVITDAGAVTLSEPAVSPEIRLAKAHQVAWTTKNGMQERGLLYLPEARADGKPPPLVIQISLVSEGYFLPDGPTRAAEAAQLLAANGIAVLQCDIPGGVNQATEGETLVVRVDAAVASLSARGLIDPNRVGLSGFSRGGYNALFAITHPGTTGIAAAVCADSFSGAYTSYIREGPAGSDFYSPIYAGDFWENKRTWLEREPFFNADRIRTPTLFTGNARTMEGEAETLNDLREKAHVFLLNSQPVECVLFPNADHQLRLPRQRAEMLRLVLDWYAFWLKGEAPVETERAARWAALRAQQEQGDKRQ